MSGFIGVPRYKAPLREDELSSDTILSFLETLLPTYANYAVQIRRDYDYVKGQQAILNKKRRFDDDSSVNSKISEPHLWAMVNFKLGYIFGKPVELASKSIDKTNEVTYLHKYINNSKLNITNILTNVAEWVYSSGVGYTYTEPKRSVDIEYDAPFVTYNLDADKAFKVYSSYLGNEPLFDVVLTTVKDYFGGTELVEKIIISVYTKYEYFEYITDDFMSNLEYNETRYSKRGYNRLPLTEFRTNEDGVGMVSLGKSLNDALNDITSMSLDNITELANELLVFLNTSLGKTEEEKRENLKNIKINGSVELNDPINGRADIKTITTQLNQSDINTRYQTIKDSLYGGLGVPLSNNRITSGNVTKGGVQSSGGWDMAYAVASKEINVLMPSIQEQIEHYLIIGNEMPNSNIKTLNIGDLDIKISISRSDNLQVKTQAYAVLVAQGVPPTIALAISELVADPETVGRKIEDYMSEKDKTINEVKVNDFIDTENDINGDNAEI